MQGLKSFQFICRSFSKTVLSTNSITFEPQQNKMVAIDPSENGSSYDSDDESLSDEDDSLGSSNVDSGEDESKRSNDRTDVIDLAQEDSHKLRTWRVIIIVVLLLSFVGTTTAVVLLLRHEANKNEDILVRNCLKPPIFLSRTRLLTMCTLFSLFSSASSIR